MFSSLLFSPTGEQWRRDQLEFCGYVVIKLVVPSAESEHENLHFTCKAVVVDFLHSGMERSEVEWLGVEWSGDGGGGISGVGGR